MHKRQK